MNSEEPRFRESEEYDVVVVGAGPAGSATAITCTRAGMRVLLVDAKSFPRRKVCGGCLNQVSLHLAQQLLGAEHPLWENSTTLGKYRLIHRGREFLYETPPGLAVDRSAFDFALVQQAQAEGAVFRDGCTAQLTTASEEYQSVELRAAGQRECVRAASVVLATGLGNLRAASDRQTAGNGACADLELLRQVPHPDSRVGVEAIFDDVPEAYGGSSIHMVVGRQGYVGLAKIAGDRLHVAAAVDRPTLQRAGPASAIEQILTEAKAGPLPDAESVVWRGTPPLTARAGRLGVRRVFLVGDAAGYVEPFTGEGIRWALQSGVGVAAFVAQAQAGWQDGLTAGWEVWYAQHIELEQRLCRRISVGLKHTGMRLLAHHVLCLQPRLATRIIARLNRKVSR